MINNRRNQKPFIFDPFFVVPQIQAADSTDPSCFCPLGLGKLQIRQEKEKNKSDLILSKQALKFKEDSEFPCCVSGQRILIHNLMSNPPTDPVNPFTMFLNSLIFDVAGV